MGAMIFSILASFFVAGYRVFLFIILMFVPGAAARFLVKKRPLDENERKKFRFVFAAVYAVYIILFRIGHCGGLTDYIKLAAIILICMSVWLTTNSLIIRIPKSKD